MRAPLTLLIIFVGLSALTEQEFKEQIENYLNQVKAREHSLYKPLSDPNLTTQEVTNQLRDELNKLFKINLVTQDLRQLLIDASTTFLGDLTAMTDLGPIKLLDYEEMNKALDNAVDRYVLDGDFEHFTELEKRLRNIIIGHVLSLGSLKRFNKHPIVDRIHNRLTQGLAKKHLSVSETETKTKNIDAFEVSLDNMATEAFDCAFDFEEFQLNAKARLFHEFQIILCSAYLKPGFLTSKNLNEIKERMAAIVGAYFVSQIKMSNEKKVESYRAMVKNSLPKMTEFSSKNELFQDFARYVLLQVNAACVGCVTLDARKLHV